jgi:hypothetical protein
LIVWAVLHAQRAVADCAQSQAQLKSTFSDLQRAKDTFKQTFLDEQKRGPANSPQEAVNGLSRAISFTEKMKNETEKSIAVLLRAEAERCFDKDGNSWSAAIRAAQQQRDQLAESITTYRQQRSQIRKNYGLAED